MAKDGDDMAAQLCDTGLGIHVGSRRVPSTDETDGMATDWFDKGIGIHVVSRHVPALMKQMAWRQTGLTQDLEFML